MFALARTVRRGRSATPLLTATLAIALSACAAAANPASTPAADGPAASPSLTAGTAGSAGPSGPLRLYASVTQNTVDAVVDGWKAAHPGVDVEVFRAPTAEVAARIATDIPSGGIRADVLWLTDPLSMAGYAGQGLLLRWTPSDAAAIDPAYRTDTFYGTRLLNVVLVAGATVSPAPADWRDLLGQTLKDSLAIPDPGFAGSAFGALGYFDAAPGYGLDFYRSLKANGAVQVKAPDDVTTGVAEGQYQVGMTLDNSVRTAVAKGSPIRLIWPSSGAIAIYSPIAVVGGADRTADAESFVEYALSADGQSRIAGTGWQPVVGSGGPQPGGRQVSPDWTAAFGRQQELLDAYRAIFGG